MADEDVANLRERREAVIERQYHPAGVAEDDIDSLALQALQQDICAGHLHGLGSSLCFGFCGRVAVGVASTVAACSPACSRASSRHTVPSRSAGTETTPRCAMS